MLIAIQKSKQMYCGKFFVEFRKKRHTFPLRSSYAVRLSGSSFTAIFSEKCSRFRFYRNCSEVACTFFVPDLAAIRQKRCDLNLWASKCCDLRVGKNVVDLAANGRSPLEITAFRQKCCDLRVGKNVVDLAAILTL